MKTRRILQLLVLVGSLTLLLGVRRQASATWAAECGHYNMTTMTNCPSPCGLTYNTYPNLGEGPYYISDNDTPYCNSYPSEGCTSATEVLSNSMPQKDLNVCGCGATGQYCEDNDDCCGIDWCQDGTCVECLSLGLSCEANADCCNGNCDDGWCCEVSGPCSSSNDCCGGAVCYVGHCLEVCSPVQANM